MGQIKDSSTSESSFQPCPSASPSDCFQGAEVLLGVPLFFRLSFGFLISPLLSLWLSVHSVTPVAPSHQICCLESFLPLCQYILLTSFSGRALSTCQRFAGSFNLQKKPNNQNRNVLMIQKEYNLSKSTRCFLLIPSSLSSIMSSVPWQDFSSSEWLFRTNVIFLFSQQPLERLLNVAWRLTSLFFLTWLLIALLIGFERINNSRKHPIIAPL